MKQKMIKRKKKESKSNALLFFLLYFSTNFRRLANRMVGQEDADRCDEENASSIRIRRGRRRQERKVVDGRRRRRKERWRSATGRQNLLDRREALQM